MIQELSQHDKKIAEDGAAKALATVCKMNNLDFFSLPLPVRKAILDSFIEGVKFVRDMLSEKGGENNETRINQTG
jgi:hypothetical protein